MNKGCWEERKLGEICEILDSKRKPITKKYRISGKYPYYGATGILDYVHDYIFSEKLILIGEDGAKWGAGDNTAFIAKGKYWVNNHAHVIRPDRSQVLDEWICYFLNFSDLQKYITGLTVPKLNQAKMRDITLPLPPLYEQQCIVAVLDEVLAAINKAKEIAEKNLQNAREVFESYLKDVFSNSKDGWEEKRFDEVCILQRGFDLPTHSRKEGAYPLVSSNGITDRINLWKVKAPGVVTGRSGTIGNVHYIEEDYWPLNTALYIKEFKENHERCIYYFLKYFDLGKYSSGAGVPTLNRNNVHSEMVWFPKSLKVQQIIVQKLDILSTETKKLEAIYQQKLNDLDELQKSILQKAFTGELTRKQ